MEPPARVDRLTPLGTEPPERSGSGLDYGHSAIVLDSGIGRRPGRGTSCTASSWRMAVSHALSERWRVRPTLLGRPIAPTREMRDRFQL